MTASTTRRSAGILLFRRTDSDQGVEVLLAYPGGPIWARKPDEGSWSIPKGLIDPDEPEWEAARREYLEEVGTPVPDGPHIELGEVKLKSGKIVIGFAVEGDLDVSTVISNTFEMAWPPRSGRMQSFPEIDRAEWFDPETARKKLNPAQAAFVDRLLEALPPVPF
ncbi:MULTISPECIES: NUDIX domain-containing protein [Gordonia]|uniref:NUDIX domain-containing protein n=1 Tax=Gordonia TaxID=2053 RepID=UPI000BB90610|nr:MULTISPECIES: NUDIX domain-containing protein [Gordonia]ATD73205.1 NUDIX hydrolase [Gordonia sp. 1D]MCR8896269.1 NUDIX domain-containing protein [Gordonia sp. GONU]MCZ4650813.1 NUDIX domain-containing protein [Gordonia amicalis]MDJ0451591.1 NUDIX domain-containing protein [Gordonia amicalis]MDV7075748.1 NUDIX domain-containing protein [Gordonia amicalis]